jgi:hypothetical protein
VYGPAIVVKAVKGGIHGPHERADRPHERRCVHHALRLLRDLARDPGQHPHRVLRRLRSCTHAAIVTKCFFGFFVFATIEVKDLELNKTRKLMLVEIRY